MVREWARCDSTIWSVNLRNYKAIGAFRCRRVYSTSAKSLLRRRLSVTAQEVGVIEVGINFQSFLKGNDGRICLARRELRFSNNRAKSHSPGDLPVAESSFCIYVATEPQVKAS